MSYQHFTPFERGQIEALHRSGESRRAIARCLGRAASSVSRELKRGQRGSGPYCARYAQKRYEHNRKGCVRKAVLDRPRLRCYVYDKLTEGWSPEQISGRLRRDFPHDGWMRVSPEAIYRRIYTDPKWNHAFSGFLRQGRKTRHKRGGAYQRRGPIAHRVSIDQRPPEVEDLSTYGHWEGDTVIGKNQRGAVVTLVERKGDWLRAVPVPSRHADVVARAVIEALADIPPHLRKTLTFDNGSEFADHRHIAEALGVDVYFAHPYSAWERARNENANGLLRQYLPKKTSFKDLTKERVENIAEALNNRPRRKQHFRTPNEVFYEQSVALEV